MIRLLLIDNYDSFTWNLAALLRVSGSEVEVLRNEELPEAEAIAANFHGLAVSPGPGLPLQAGQTPDRVAKLIDRLPVLGVCLGHQLLAELTGGALVRCPEPVHGKTSRLKHDRTGLFKGLPTVVEVMRYHSWAVDENSLPAGWRVNARTSDSHQAVMSIEWPERALWGVQFHPESILTPWGHKMIENWIEAVNLRSTTLLAPDQQPAWNIC